MLVFLKESVNHKSLIINFIIISIAIICHNTEDKNT